MCQSSQKVRASASSFPWKASAEIAFDSFQENLLKLFMELSNR
jgi:hypothetical protein